MDTKFVNPVLSSVVNVLTTMAQLEVKSGKPVAKTDNVALGAVTGVISMEGKRAKASLAISFSKPVIIEIVKRMLRMDVTEVDEMAMDLTGEIANMVMGGAKGILQEEGYEFGLSLPEVLSGENHVVKHPYTGPKILLPLQTEFGEFYIEICFEE